MKGGQNVMYINSMHHYMMHIFILSKCTNLKIISLLNFDSLASQIFYPDRNRTELNRTLKNKTYKFAFST